MEIASTIPADAIADLGCGPNKVSGAFGIDHFKYPGVDLVADLNETHWKIPDNSFGELHSRHVIEHVKDVVLFMKEIHRISKPGGLVHISTPHFSSVNSYEDPTHLRHMSAHWYEFMLDGKYMNSRVATFELVSTRVTFGKSLQAQIGSWIVSARGLKKWEKSLAFVFPGMDIQTTLRVLK